MVSQIEPILKWDHFQSVPWVVRFPGLHCNFNDGIKQEDDCYKVLLNCTTEHPKYHAKCRLKSNKQTNNVTCRVRRNLYMFIRTCGVLSPRYRRNQA